MLIGLMERRRGGVDINILQLQLMNSVIKLFIDKMSSNVQGCVIMKLMWHCDLRSIINMWHPYYKTTHMVFSIEIPLCKRELHSLWIINPTSIQFQTIEHNFDLTFCGTQTPTFFTFAFESEPWLISH